MDNLIRDFHTLKLDHCREAFLELVTQKKALLARDYGKEKNYREVFKTLPQITPSSFSLFENRISIGTATDTGLNDLTALKKVLKNLSPWRKGPFRFFGIDVDTEWASYMKWNRLKDKISSLNGRRVLDVGCSSGYYMIRMLEQKPLMVLGVDPQVLFYYQFSTIQHYLNLSSLYYLPIRMEELPGCESYFDSLFSMGILYHRKSPVETLQDYHRKLRTDGELILETLVIDGDSDTALFPTDRYAKMKNVYFIPTLPCLFSWLHRARFSNIEIIDQSWTTTEEQRKTEWVQTESLEDFLDPENPKKTVEGYPAPQRAIIRAHKK